MGITDDLIRRGHFPKELPPPFNTESFADFALSQGSALIANLLGNKASICLRHNVARPGGMRRPLSIPHPGHHYQLCELVDSAWTSTLEPLLNNSRISASIPVRATSGRAFVARTPPSTEDLRAQARAAGRYLLVTDIQNFYPTLYTHSVPWALHGKMIAKSNRTMKLIGNQIDKALRQMQDRQTVGVPIGPDSSMIIAECLLSAVETELINRIPDIVGYRFRDDIELQFGSRAEAEAAAGSLQEILGDYELALNPRKTRVVELPEAMEERGIPEIREWNFRNTPQGRKRDIHAFFDHVFTTVSSARGGNTAAFAIARLRDLPIDSESWKLLEANSLQLLVAEPSCARQAAMLFERATSAGHAVSVPGLARATERLADHHAALGHGSEVAWALFMSIR